MSAKQDAIEALSTEVATLRDQVEVLRNAVDELRESLDYAVFNDKPATRFLDARRISSMPENATAEDFAERVNRFSPEDVSAESVVDGDETETSGVPATQKELFGQGQKRPATAPAEPAMASHEEVDAEGKEAGELADQVKRFVEGAVEQLHDYAARIKHTATLGDRYIDEVWDNHGTRIRELLSRIENFRTLAEQNGIDGEAVIERLGGIPVSVSIETVPARDLLRKIREHLEAAGGQVGISELRQAMGYPGFNPHDPMTNPVHQALSDLREANVVDCYEPDFGEARFSLTVPVEQPSGQLF